MNRRDLLKLGASAATAPVALAQQLAWTPQLFDAHQNELLGEFILTGLREAKRGEVEIEVTFDINSEGIVSVSARDKETGQRQSITVTASGGLTEEELQKIMEEQGDYLLEAKVSEELKTKRAELDTVLKEVSALLPQVQKITEGSEFGVDAVAKAIKSIEAARRSLEVGSLSAVSESVDTLHRTMNLFKGVMQRIGNR